MPVLRPALSLLLACGLAAAEGAPAGTAPGDAPDPVTVDASYVVGRELAQQVDGIVARMGLDRERLVAGIQDGIAGRPSSLSEERSREVMEAFEARQRERAEAQAAKEQAEVARRGERNAAFLAENAQRQGVRTTDSGLQYEVLTEGTGRQPTRSDRVRVEYEGRLLDGTVFDASARHNGPVAFGVGEVIPGWTEALTLMKEGGRWRLWIKPELAYGRHGGGPIGPDELLVFDVTLVEVVAADAPSGEDHAGHGH